MPKRGEMYERPLPEPRPMTINGPTVDEHLPRRYLTILAEAAERLLAAGDPAAMVDSLFALIRDELRLDVFFNYRLEGDALHLEAHAGLTEVQAMAGARLRLGQAVCGCVARDRQRVHATAIQASDDPMLAFVRDVGLDAYACTPLIHDRTLLGTLGFGRRWSRAFSDDELSLIHTLCHFVALAKDRLRTQAELAERVAERERLLGELNHRVRNALQLAISIVRMDVRSASNDEARRMMDQAVGRLEVMAMAHRPLYVSERSDHVDLGTLLASVAEQAAGREIVVAAEADGAVPVEQAVALALVIHANLPQDGGGDAMSIRLCAGGEGEDRTIEVTTNAAGFPVDAPRAETMLLRQLRARVDRGPGRFALTLPTVAA